MSKLPAWPDLETRFAALPRLGVAAVCQRAAARACPGIAVAENVYGEVAVEWMNAIAQVLKVMGSACQGRAVSRFTLDIAAEIARGTANSARNAVREKGPTLAAEAAELAFASAAFAVDVLRAAQPARAASAAVSCLRNAMASGDIPERLIAADFQLLDRLTGLDDIDWDAAEGGPFGELWPFGDPDWWTAGVARLRELEPVLPKLLRLPGMV